MYLSPSQSKAKLEIIKKSEIIARRIIFLIGNRGVGKTFLLKSMSSSENNYVSALNLDLDSSENIEDDFVNEIEVHSEKISTGWLFFDDLDPFLFDLKINNRLESTLIRLMRSYFKTNIVFASNFLQHELFNLEMEGRKSKAILSYLNSDNLVELKFTEDDSIFLFEKIRGWEGNNTEFTNFYEV